MKKILALAAIALPLIITSCLKDEPYAGPPKIGKIELSPKMGAITPEKDVTVTATVTPEGSDVASVELKYTVSGAAEQTLAMTGSGDKYTAVIPRQAENAEVELWVVAKSVQDKEAVSSKSKYTVSWTIVNYGTLADIIISEVNCTMKFIEIYNPTENPVNLGGLRFAKNGTTRYFARTDNTDGVADGVILESGKYAVYGCKNFVTTNVDADALLLGTSGDGLSGGKSVLVMIQDADGNNYDYFANIGKSGHSPDDACWDIGTIGEDGMEHSFEAPNPGSVSRFKNETSGEWEWYISDVTCGAANTKQDGAYQFKNTINLGAKPAAVITSVTISPETPTLNDDVTVTAVVANAKSVTLNYKVDDVAAQPVTMDGTSGTYTATIPK